MKSLGIVGGIGPESTIDYYRSLIQMWREQTKDGSAPSILVNSIDLKKMLDLIAANALSEVTAYLSGEMDRLARAGADVGLLASNTPHIVFGELGTANPQRGARDGRSSGALVRPAVRAGNNTTIRGQFTVGSCRGHDLSDS